MLAIPLPVDAFDPPLVAAAMFITEAVREESQIAAVRCVGVPSTQLYR
jgi:hypothetical protein